MSNSSIGFQPNHIFGSGSKKSTLDSTLALSRREVDGNTIYFRKIDRGEGKYIVVAESVKFPSPKIVEIVAGRKKISLFEQPSPDNEQYVTNNLRELLSTEHITESGETFRVKPKEGLLGGGQCCGKMKELFNFGRSIETFCYRLINSSSTEESIPIMEEALGVLEDPENIEIMTPGKWSLKVDYTCHNNTGRRVLLQLFISERAPMDLFKRLLVYHEKDNLLFGTFVWLSRTPTAYCCLSKGNVGYLKALHEHGAVLKNGNQSKDHVDHYELNLVELAVNHGTYDAIEFLAEKAVEEQKAGDSTLFDQFNDAIPDLLAKRDVVFQEMITIIDSDSPFKVVTPLDKFGVFGSLNERLDDFPYKSFGDARSKPPPSGKSKIDYQRESCKELRDYCEQRVEDTNAIIVKLKDLGLSPLDSQSSDVKILDSQSGGASARVAPAPVESLSDAQKRIKNMTRNLENTS